MVRPTREDGGHAPALTAGAAKPRGSPPRTSSTNPPARRTACGSASTSDHLAEHLADLIGPAERVSRSAAGPGGASRPPGPVQEPAAGRPRRSRRAPDPTRRRRRRGGTPSARSRAPPRAGRRLAQTSSQSSTYSPSVGSQRAAGGSSVAPREAVGRRVRVGVERRLPVARVARPPADRDLLGVHRVAHDEVVGRRLGGLAGEQVDGEVERAPPGVDRGRAAAVGGAEGRQHERGARGGVEVGGDLLGVVGGVLLVLVERHASTRPPAASGRSDVAGELARRVEHARA